MNQTIETLIKELGVKVSKLSDKKIQLSYTTSIYFHDKISYDPSIFQGFPATGEYGSLCFLSKVDLKIRYKLNEEGVYVMLYPRPVLLNRISNKFRVKKKHINYSSFSPSFAAFNGDSIGNCLGYKINNIIQCIYITDQKWYKEWSRNEKINSILQ